MTEQKEIREGIAERYFILHCKERGIEYKVLMWRELPELQKTWFLHLAQEELKYLHSQGVVIGIGDRWDETCKCYCKAVEPLIKEVTNEA